MTSPVNNVTFVLNALRKQMADRAQGITQPGKALSRQNARKSAPGVEARIRARILALDPTDPQCDQNAKRAFLHVVLQNEFGDAFSGSAEFSSLVDQVAASMTEDPSLLAAFDRLLVLIRTEQSPANKK